ncbi:DUF5819 family protein [Streptomyces sp. NBC_00212]
MDSYKDETGAGGKADGAGSGQVRAASAGSGDPAASSPGASAGRGTAPETGAASGPGDDAVFDSSADPDRDSATRAAADPARDSASHPDLVTVPDPVSGPAEAPGRADSGRADAPGPMGSGGAGASSRGIAGLPVRFQVVAALALAVIGVIACVQIGMVFLHVAPSNTVSKEYGKAVDDWIYPEFEQNWKLFAPNPLQQNIDVQARAEIKMPGGTIKTTDWIDFSAQDGDAIRHNPLPSHTEQNELRRGWDFFVGSHTDDNKPNGLRGELSEQYLRRIVMLRLGAHRDGGTVDRIQVRSMTTSVKGPSWSDEKTDTRPSYREVPWWTVTPADLPKGAGDAHTEAKR